MESQESQKPIKFQGQNFENPWILELVLLQGALQMSPT